MFWQVSPDCLKERFVQIGLLTTLQVGSLIKYIKSIQCLIRKFSPLKMGKRNTLFCDVFAFLANGFALAGREHCKKAVKAVVIAVMPVKLTTDPVKLLVALQ